MNVNDGGGATMVVSPNEELRSETIGAPVTFVIIGADRFVFLPVVRAA